MGKMACAVGLIVSVWGGLCQQASAQDAVDDIEVCPASADIVDPEFSPSGRYLVYANSVGELRVVRLKADGLPVLGDCQGNVVDHDVIWRLPDLTFRQGAEWGRGAAGEIIYYTRLLPDGRAALARGWLDEGGWQNELMPRGEDRGLPTASVDADDPHPRIMYLRRLSNGKHVPTWREDDSSGVEAAFPGSGNPDSGGVPRWVAGRRAISMSRDDGSGVRQAALYDIDTRTTTYLTTDAGHKDEVWVWQAPEFGGAWAMMAVVDSSSLRIYREGFDGWVEVRRLNAPEFSGLAAIYSPEPFVHEGRSYVTMQVGMKKWDHSQIWVSAVDDGSGLLRQASNDEVAGARGEPEWLATRGGVYVYYTEYRPSLKSSLRRARAGID